MNEYNTFVSTANVNSTPVTDFLDAKHIPYRFFRHHGQVVSLEQAAHERGQKPEQVVRSIVFRLSDGVFIMVLIAGPNQISWTRLRAYLRTSRITLASPEEIKQQTGYPVGAVSPLGLPNPIRILVDQSVLEQEEISLGSGVRNTSVILQVKDLLSAIGQYETVNLSSGQDL